LEPRDSRAGAATRTITAKMPAASEPVIVLVETRDAEDFHTRWTKLHAAWKPLVEQGRLKSIATPAPFAISPERVRANAVRLGVTALAAARRSLQETLARTRLCSGECACCL